MFPGSDLPGVYGAGAFQTLVNRDLIHCAERLFIIGGGNVGVIAAYHALQAGIDVVGLVEALPACGGYKVHVDKIKRLGVPVWTSHTILKAEGEGCVERVVVASIDSNFEPVAGTERVLEADTVLVAVGLSPVNELLEKAKLYGIPTYAAGDAEEIAEASAAIFSGKIVGRKIARDLGLDIGVPEEWEPLAEILKSRPGLTLTERPQSFGSKASFSLFGQNLYRADTRSGALRGQKITDALGFEMTPGNDFGSTSQFLSESHPPQLEERYEANVYPMIHCYQEIPCNPCAFACPLDSITMDGNIMNLPEFSGKCLGCERCLLACPGPAITLVHPRHDTERNLALVALPYEFHVDLLGDSDSLKVTDFEGSVIGEGRIVDIKDLPKQDRRKIIYLEVPVSIKDRVAGFRVREPDDGVPLPEESAQFEGDPIVCLCERIRKSEIVAEIRRGVRDMNQLKATLRTGMGACGGKTCTSQIQRIFREEGVEPGEVTLPTDRPFVAEVHLGDFLNVTCDKEGE